MSFFAGRDSPPVKSEIITGDPERHLVGDKKCDKVVEQFFQEHPQKEFRIEGEIGFISV